MRADVKHGISFNQPNITYTSSYQELKVSCATFCVGSGDRDGLGRVSNYSGSYITFAFHQVSLREIDIVDRYDCNC